MSSLKTRYIPILSTALPEEALVEVYNKLKREGSLRWLFFDGEVLDAASFIKIARDSNNLLYVVVDEEEEDLVCVFWLNGRTSINCTAHGAYFKKYFKRSVNIQKYLIKWVFTNLSELESMIGFIPENNRLAISFAYKTGWTKVGKVPNLIKDITTKESTSGIMFYILRNEV